MNDNNSKLAVIKLAVETITPTAEKLGLRFIDMLEKTGTSSDAVGQAEVTARYATIQAGSEANVQTMLSNEKELGLAAFSFLSKLFDKGIGLVEKGMDLKAVKEAARYPERAANIASTEMETRLAERKLAIAEMEAQARMMEAKARLAREERELLEEKEKAAREERAVKAGGDANNGRGRQSDVW